MRQIYFHTERTLGQFSVTACLHWSYFLQSVSSEKLQETRNAFTAENAVSAVVQSEVENMFE